MVNIILSVFFVCQLNSTVRPLRTVEAGQVWINDRNDYENPFAKLKPIDTLTVVAVESGWVLYESSIDKKYSKELSSMEAELFKRIYEPIKNQ